MEYSRRSYGIIIINIIFVVFILYFKESLTVGPSLQYEEGEIPNHCQCCSRIIDKEYMPLNSNAKELAFLGSGFPL